MPHTPAATASCPTEGWAVPLILPSLRRGMMRSSNCRMRTMIVYSSTHLSGASPSSIFGVAAITVSPSSLVPAGSGRDPPGRRQPPERRAPLGGSVGGERLGVLQAFLGGGASLPHGQD